MPELFIGIKLSNSPTPTLVKNQCPICLKQLLVAKVLSCGHFLCLSCFENLQNENFKLAIVLCPFDKAVTKVESGDGKNVQTKFFIQIKCDDCGYRKNFHKSWWCETCACTSCSDCAMRKHRQHSCDSWDALGVVSQCYSFIRSKNCYGSLQSLEDMRNNIKNFCQELESNLVRHIDKQASIAKAQKTLEDTFGTVAALDGNNLEKKKFDNMDKKISLLSELIPKLFGVESGSLAIPKGALSRPISLPPMQTTVEFCTSSGHDSKQKIANARHDFLFGNAQDVLQEKEKLLY